MKVSPTWALECAEPDCTFRPDLTEKAQIIEDHYRAEHPGKDLTLTLVILCPEDGSSLIFCGEQGTVEGDYSCPACQHTFHLAKNPLEAE